MILDKTNENAIAGLHATAEGAHHHGVNYVIYTDGTGAFMEIVAGSVWTPWEALPMEDVVTLNEGTGEYETAREFVVEIANVQHWTPWTVVAADGTWYFRADARMPFEAGAASGEATDTSAPEEPDGYVLSEA